MIAQHVAVVNAKHQACVCVWGGGMKGLVMQDEDHAKYQACVCGGGRGMRLALCFACHAWRCAVLQTPCATALVLCCRVWRCAVQQPHALVHCCAWWAAP